MAKAVALNFGRMNPPTIGHEKLANAVKKTAKQYNAEPRLYLSHSQDSKKNPLDYNTKIALAQKAFGIAVNSPANNIFQIAKELEKEGVDTLIVVVGSDRYSEFKTLLNKYNGKEYNFDKIVVASAGERDPDAEGAEGMSGTKLRQLAMAGNFSEFSTGLASKLNNADRKKVYDLIRKNIKEEKEANMSDSINKLIASFIKEAQIETKAPDTQAFKTFKESLNEAKDDFVVIDPKSGKVLGKFDTQSKADKFAKIKKADVLTAKEFKLMSESLDEGKMKELHMYMQQGKSPEWIAKKMGLDVKTIKSLIGETIEEFYVAVKYDAKGKKTGERKVFKDLKSATAYASKMGKEYRVHSEASARADALKAMGSRRGIDPADIDTDSDAADDEKDVNIIMQLRKVISLRGIKPVKFSNGKSVKLTVPQAQAALQKFNNKRTSLEKGAYMKKLQKSPEDFKKALSEDADINEIVDSFLDESQRIKKKLIEHGSSGHDGTKKKSKYTVAYHKAFPEEILHEKEIDALKTKAAKSGIPYSILKQVYDRGMAAWQKSHRPGAGQHQWAFARVNSFITGGKTRTTGDADLWKKVKK